MEQGMERSRLEEERRAERSKAEDAGEGSTRASRMDTARLAGHRLSRPDLAFEVFATSAPTPMPPLGAVLGILVGLTLGLLGGGGSVLTVPIFVYVLGLEAKAAIAGSLAVVGTVSLVGAARHARAGNVALRTALVFGPVAMVGAYAGARGAAWIPGGVQLVLFAVVMLVAAGFMLKGRRPTAGEGRTAPPVVVAITAVAVGALTGVVGVGGGFVIVPALVLLLRVPIKRAVGTSLLVIAFNAAAGFAGYVGQVPLPVPLLVGFGAFAVAGIVVGTHLVEYVSAAALRRGFAFFLVAVALFMIVQNLAALG